jgi:ring-1,2-phenylacetyl-CoA epoxidase subunit PaaB
MENTKDSQGKLWEVFVQKKPGLAYVHCGNLHAFDGEMALQNARDLYTRRNEGNALWVVPSDAIVASSPEDIGSFFEPANDKVFRHPTFYKIPDEIKHM